MADRNSEDRSTRKLTQMGDSIGLTLPIELVRELGWRDNQKVTVSRWGENKLIIEDWQE